MKKRDTYTYTINNYHLLKKGMVNEALDSYEMLKNSKYKPDLIFYNILMHGLVKQKEYDKAYLVWQDMDSRNFRPNDFCISTTIQLFTYLNMQDEALKYYEKHNF